MFSYMYKSGKNLYLSLCFKVVSPTGFYVIIRQLQIVTHHILLGYITVIVALHPRGKIITFILLQEALSLVSFP